MALFVINHNIIILVVIGRVNILLVIIKGQKMKRFGVVFFTIALIFAFCSTKLKSETVRNFDMAGTLQLGISLPMGDWSEGWSTSFGAIGSFEYKVTEDISALASIGYIQWSRSVEEYTDWNFYSIPIHLAGHYYFSATRDFRPYGGVEVGVHMMRMEMDAHVGYKERIYDDVYVAFSPVVGALIPFGQDDFYINASIKYTNVLVDESTFSYLAIWAGITYPF